MSAITRVLILGHMGLGRLLGVGLGGMPSSGRAPRGESCPRPRASLVIVGLPRSGGNLLAFGVAATGRGGRAEEYLSGNALFASALLRGIPVVTPSGHLALLWKQLRRKPDWPLAAHYTAASLRHYVQILLNHCTGANGVFSIKVHWGHLDRQRRSAGFDLDWLPEPAVWVRLRRRDRLGQAISWHRAHQTGQWTSRQQTTDQQPRYDGAELRNLVERFERQDRCWDRYLAERGIQPLELTYEELTADYEGSIRRVLAAIGEQVDQVPPPQLQRQADHINEEWRRRFLAEHPDWLNVHAYACGETGAQERT